MSSRLSKPDPGADPRAESPVALGIRKAWAERFDQRIESCLNEVIWLKQALGLPFQLDTWAPDLRRLARAPIEAEWVAEALLLAASLERAGSRLEASDHLLQKAASILAQLGSAEYPQLLFQGGLNRFARGQYAAALEQFVRAKLANERRKRESHALYCDLRAFALLNTLLCLENLGLPYSQTRMELGELLAADAALRESPGFRSQLRGLELRERFRDGRISAIFTADELAGGGLEVDQGLYYRAWVRALPFHAAHGDSRPALERILVRGEGLYMSQYRVRTLQGLLHPADAQVSKPSECVDRAYLWIWRWLKDPARFPVAKALAVLCQAQPWARPELMTEEDQVLLHLGLLWLSLFDPQSDRAVSEAVRSLVTPEPSKYPLFSLEYLVLHHLIALRNRDAIRSQDYRRALEVHPLWDSRDLLFRDLCESVVDPARPVRHAPFESLADCLREHLACGQGRGDALIVVDRVRSLIEACDSGRKTISEPLCAAMDALKAGMPVSCEEFAEACFGIRQYDSLVHLPRIFNLLARARRLFPGSEITFHVKAGQVLGQGRWDLVRFETCSTHSKELRAQPDWKRVQELLSPKAGTGSGPARLGAAPALAAAHRSEPPLDVRPILSRLELQAMLARPRSTTNRILCQWLEKGWIRREGRSRSTVYRLSPRLQEKLKRQEID